MSRRHHGRPRQQTPGVDGARPAPQAIVGPPRPNLGGRPPQRTDNQRRDAAPMPAPNAPETAPQSALPAGGAPIANEAPTAVPTNGYAHNGAPQTGAPINGHEAPSGQPGHGQPVPTQDRNTQCTAPQLRRFIKSRPYVPMHELRRRFGIDGGDDDVTPVRLDPTACVYVGLPSREGALLGELLRAGDVGYELSLDPRTPIVIGVYPMRPIPLETPRLTAGPMVPHPPSHGTFVLVRMGRAARGASSGGFDIIVL